MHYSCDNWEDWVRHEDFLIQQDKQYDFPNKII